MTEIPESNPFVGQLLDGRYRIVREIASGGMSVVYQATHVKIGRTVAIKVLHRDMAGEPDVVARFLNEARAVGTFGHPNIVASTDFGELPGHVPYLVLEYLEGHTLSHDVVTTGPLSVPRVVRIALQIASALDAAHARDVIHRDLTSANIFLVKHDGNPDHVKVLDFGISKFLSGGEGGPKTRRGLTMGTPEFMAPEQISDPDQVDSRVDVYALGIIMYHMLAGRYPFTRTPLQSLLTQIVVDPPPAIDRLGMPEGLRTVVMRALAKRPADRFASMREMGEALEQLALQLSSTPEWNPPDGQVVDWRSRAWSAPIPRLVAAAPSSPLQVSTSATASPASRPGLSGADATAPSPSSSSALATKPGEPARGHHRLLYVALGLAAVSLGAVGFLVLRQQRTPPPVAPLVLPVPSPPVAPPVAAAPEPVAVHVGITSATPQARVTLRGRTHRLPYVDDVRIGAAPEVVELTAPGRVGRRFWVTFDRAVAMSVELSRGRGVVEASGEETVVALGGQSLDREPASHGAGPAAESSGPGSGSPSSSRHESPHHRQNGSRPADSKTSVAAAPTPTEPTPEIMPPALTPPKADAPTTPKAAVPAAPKTATSATPKAAAPTTPGSPNAGVTAPLSSAPKVSPVAAAPAPTTAAAPAAARGLDPAKTQATVRGHLPEIQRCYERGKMDEPELRGRVTLKISVSATGAVSSVTVETSTLHSSAVESCMIATVGGWTFAPPAGGPAVISYPFNLH